MSNVRAKVGMVCLAALVAPIGTAQVATAEGARDAAPIVFASANDSSRQAAGAPHVLGGGSLDIRGAVQPASFAAPVGAAPPVRTGAAPAPEGWSRPFAGPPYQVKGKWFVPMHEPDYDEVGIASWYGPGFDGELASAGETFDQDALTAAHPTLPIPSVVRVTNLENNRSVLLRLNDRGPYVDDRIIDLSRGAADRLDVRRNGTAKVRVQYVGPAPTDADAELTERMFAQSQPTMQPVLPTGSDDVWSAPMPAAAGMPERPASQASAEAYDEPEAAPTPVTARPAALEGGYALQVGSFTDLANAHRALGEFTGEAGYVTSAVVNGGQYYRVMLGPWPDKATAENARKGLVSNGRSALVVTLDR